MSQIAPSRDPQLSRRYLPVAVTVGALSLLAGLAVHGGALIVVTSFVDAIQAGARGCLPRDFPTYPGAQLYGTRIDFGYPAGCSVEDVVDADESEVANYYTTNLNTGGWRVTGTDNADGVINFERASNPAVYGRLRIRDDNGETVIQIDFTRS